MKVIEIRRHSCTRKGDQRGIGSHLSAAGVELAREVGEGMPAASHVMTSNVQRTLETALAMGFAVDRQIGPPPGLAEAALSITGHLDRWSWARPWQHFHTLALAHVAVRDYGNWFRRAWLDALTQVADRERVLVISHGSDIELGVNSCLDDSSIEDLGSLGELLHQCEGVTLHHDGDGFRLGAIHRTRRCSQPDDSGRTNTGD